MSLTVCGKSDCFAVSMFDERVFPYSPQGGFRYFKGHFRTRWCLRCVFCSVMHHCVVRRSGSVPTEITEPTLEARSSRHVFIETLQSKDFLAILLICGNFQITAFRVHSSLEAKNHIENRATSETVWAQFIFWCAKFESKIYPAKSHSVFHNPPLCIRLPGRPVHHPYPIYNAGTGTP